MKPVRKRIRLKDYDYSRDGLYYFTSNVKNKVCFFGEVRNGRMYLNEYGKIVLEQWNWLEEQYPYVVLHAFIVMPNHIHGILEIRREKLTEISNSRIPVSTSTIRIKPAYDLIGAFKMTASKLIGLLEKKNSNDAYPIKTFTWQRSFNDHIIRGQKAYLRISSYIIRNPENWEWDEFFPKKLSG